MTSAPCGLSEAGGVGVLPGPGNLEGWPVFERNNSSVVIPDTDSVWREYHRPEATDGIFIQTRVYAVWPYGWSSTYVRSFLDVGQQTIENPVAPYLVTSAVNDVGGSHVWDNFFKSLLRGITRCYIYTYTFLDCCKAKEKPNQDPYILASPKKSLIASDRHAGILTTPIIHTASLGTAGHGRGRRLGLDKHLENADLAFVVHAIQFGHIFKRNPVGDHKRRVELSGDDVVLEDLVPVQMDGG